MASLDEFDPRPIVAKWLARIQRRCKQTQKAKEQRWFKGIFKEANSAIGEDNKEDKIKLENLKVCLEDKQLETLITIIIFMSLFFIYGQYNKN